MKSLSVKKIVTGLAAASLLSLTILPAALAEEVAPEAEAAVGLYSKYVWRGFELSEDSLVIQPSVTVAYKGFGINLWGNLDTNQSGMESQAFNWNETDLTLSYDGAVGMVGYSLGYIYYNLDDLEDTQEVYAGLSLDVLLAPTLTVYKDIANLPGWYGTFGIGHSLAINDKLALDLGARVGYLDNDADYHEFHDGLLSASLSYAVNDRITVGPELYYSFPLTDKASDLIESLSFDGDDSSFLYGGLSASFAF